MPSNPKEEFHWVSIDRGPLKNKLLEVAKDKIVHCHMKMMYTLLGLSIHPIPIKELRNCHPGRKIRH